LAKQELTEQQKMVLGVMKAYLNNQISALHCAISSFFSTDPKDSPGDSKSWIEFLVKNEEILSFRDDRSDERRANGDPITYEMTRQLLPEMVDYVEWKVHCWRGYVLALTCLKASDSYTVFYRTATSVAAKLKNFLNFQEELFATTNPYIDFEFVARFDPILRV